MFFGKTAYFLGHVPAGLLQGRIKHFHSWLGQGDVYLAAIAGHYVALNIILSDQAFDQPGGGGTSQSEVIGHPGKRTALLAADKEQGAKLWNGQIHIPMAAHFSADGAHNQGDGIHNCLSTLVMIGGHS